MRTNDLTLKGTWEFQTNLVGKVGGEPENWDKTRKKDLTEINFKKIYNKYGAS